MSKFHMSDDGPKPCKATIKCPVGWEYGTEKEIQSLYEEKMTKEHGTPAVSKSKLTPTKARKLFDENTKYGDKNYAPVLNWAHAFKMLDDRGYGGQIEVEDGGDPYNVKIRYTGRASELSDDDKEWLGFESDDTIVPFSEMNSKRNVVWMTPGIQFNRNTLYAETYRYEIEDGADLKKLFDISQEHIEKLIDGSLEDESEVRTELSYDEPEDVVYCDRVKSLRTRLR